jgi:hypothetical protein
MFDTTRHWRLREFRFLTLVSLTVMVIALHLGSSLQLMGQGGTGWRAVDRVVLQRRIDSGDLRDREASWYHSATDEEKTHVGGKQ